MSLSDHRRTAARQDCEGPGVCWFLARKRSEDGMVVWDRIGLVALLKLRSCAAGWVFAGFEHSGLLVQVGNGGCHRMAMFGVCSELGLPMSEGVRC